MTTTTANLSVKKSWYREPWPWILMAGPAVVIVAGFVTAWLAITSSDGLVTDNYYKKGLAIDQTLTQSRLAESLGLEARARFSSDQVAVRLSATQAGEAGAYTLPPSLSMTLSHPTRAGLDRQVKLTSREGQYVGDVRLPASGHWLVLIEDEGQTWRMLGNVVLPASGEVVIGGKSSLGG